MAFDKKKYWEEKASNIGSKRPKPAFTPWPYRTRRESRKKIVAKVYKDANDVIGKRHTAKGVIRRIKQVIFHPSQDPSTTNHSRHQARQALRNGR